MSYLYGVKFQMEENDLILSLREVFFFFRFLDLHYLMKCIGTLPTKLLLHLLACTTKQCARSRHVRPTLEAIRHAQCHSLFV